MPTRLNKELNMNLRNLNTNQRLKLADNSQVFGGFAAA